MRTLLMVKVTACPWSEARDVPRGARCARWTARVVRSASIAAREEERSGFFPVLWRRERVASSLRSLRAEVESPPSGRFHEEGRRGREVGATEGSGERAVGPDHR